MSKRKIAQPGQTRAQIIINLPLQVSEEITTIGGSLGFPSRAGYLLALHHWFKSSLTLSVAERTILRYLINYDKTETPDILQLDHATGLGLIDCTKCLDTMTRSGFLVELPLSAGEGTFQFDIIAEKNRYQLTNMGRVAARASLLFK